MAYYIFYIIIEKETKATNQQRAGAHPNLSKYIITRDLKRSHSYPVHIKIVEA